MATRLDRLASMIRWAVIAWVVYCAYQMIRWWRFDVPALVGGWFWIGSFWNCLLCFTNRSRIRRNDWGARMALFGPLLLVMWVFSYRVWFDLGFDIGTTSLWPLWSLAFDTALLTWGWELPRRRLLGILVASTLIGSGVFVTMDVTFDVSIGVIVGGLVVMSLFLLRKNDVAIRPPGLTLSVGLLAAVDVALMASFRFDDAPAFDWCPLALARMGIQSLVGWRLSRARHDEMERASASDWGWLSFLPTRTIRTIAFSGALAWTWYVCWLYPRCVATCRAITEKTGYSFWHSETEPEFLSDHTMVFEMWLTAQRKNSLIVVLAKCQPIPEYLFEIREVRRILFFRSLDNATLTSLHRYPCLDTVTIWDASQCTAAWLQALSALPQLTSLNLRGINLSISDFNCFSDHSRLDLELSGHLLKSSPEEQSITRASIIALSRLQSLDLTLESTCDDDLARQLCEVGSLRKLAMRDIKGITAPTLNRLLGLNSLQEAELTIRGIGESISLVEIADSADQMPPETVLKLIFPDVPLADTDLRVLDWLGDNRFSLKTLREEAIVREDYSRTGLSVQLTISGDDSFEQLCAIRSLKTVGVKVNGISEQGLCALSQYGDWYGWSVSFDLTNLSCPAHEWTELIPKSVDWQIIVTPDVIHTDDDVVALRSLEHRTPRDWFNRHDHIHVLCDQPTVATLERLKRLCFPAQLIVNLADQDLTIDELARIIEAIPTSDFEIDLRLPRTTLFSESHVALLATLYRFEKLRLEVDLTDSAMATLAQLPGLYDLDLRGSNLGPQGLECLTRCPSLRALRINPGLHLHDLMTILRRCSDSMKCVMVGGPNVDVMLSEMNQLISEDLNLNDDSRSIELVPTDELFSDNDFRLYRKGNIVIMADDGFDQNFVFEYPIKSPRPRTR